MCVRVWGAKQTVPLPVDPSSCTRGDGRAVFPNRQEIPSFCPCLCVRLASSFSVSVSCTHTHTLAHKRVSRPHCQANTSPALPRVCTPENHNFSVCRKCPPSLSFSLSLSPPWKCSQETHIPLQSKGTCSLSRQNASRVRAGDPCPCGVHPAHGKTHVRGCAGVCMQACACACACGVFSRKKSDLSLPLLETQGVLLDHRPRWGRGSAPLR